MERCDNSDTDTVRPVVREAIDWCWWHRLMAEWRLDLVCMESCLFLPLSSSSYLLGKEIVLSCWQESFSVGEGEGGMIWENSIETCVLSYVKQIASPGLMHETGSQGWCPGMTLRHRMGREVGGGFRMENTCTLMADSCQCMAKPTTML